MRNPSFSSVFPSPCRSSRSALPFTPFSAFFAPSSYPPFASVLRLHHISGIHRFGLIFAICWRLHCMYMNAWLGWIHPIAGLQLASGSTMTLIHHRQWILARASRSEGWSPCFFYRHFCLLPCFSLPGSRHFSGFLPWYWEIPMVLSAKTMVGPPFLVFVDGGRCGWARHDGSLASDHPSFSFSFFLFPCFYCIVWHDTNVEWPFCFIRSLGWIVGAGGFDISSFFTDPSHQDWEYLLGYCTFLYNHLTMRAPELMIPGFVFFLWSIFQTQHCFFRSQ